MQRATYPFGDGHGIIDASRGAEDDDDPLGHGYEEVILPQPVAELLADNVIMGVPPWRIGSTHADRDHADASGQPGCHRLRLGYRCDRWCAHRHRSPVTAVNHSGRRLRGSRTRATTGSPCRNLRTTTLCPSR